MSEQRSIILLKVGLFKILALTILFSGFKSYAQDLNRKDLITQLKADKESVFIINGAPFSYADSLRLDSALNKMHTNKIVQIEILKNSGETAHLRNDAIIIQYATELPREIIRAKFKEVKPKFKDKYLGFSQHILNDAKDPVLYLNGNKVHHTKIKSFISKLQVNDIAYIYFSKASQDAAYYGQNAKNGLVVIWTKDKLAE